jgi:hypothetical protein
MYFQVFIKLFIAKKGEYMSFLVASYPDPVLYVWIRFRICNTFYT